MPPEYPQSGTVDGELGADPGPVSLLIGTRGNCKTDTAAALCKGYDVGYFKAGHGADGCVGAMAYDIGPDLQLDLDPVRGLGLALDRRFGLGAGFAFTAGRVVRAGFPRSAVGGYAVHGLVRAGLQGVQAGRPPCSCSDTIAAVFAAAGSGMGASESGFGSGRYPSCCGRVMTAAASGCVVWACAVRRGGQGWPAAIAACCSRSMARSTAARSASN